MTTNWNTGPRPTIWRTRWSNISGTKAYGFPVVVSALIDAQGLLAGIRIVSDPRDTSQNRDEAYLLRNFLTARFGRDDWQCQDLPLENGETAVDGVFVKQRCRKQIDGNTSRVARDPLSAQARPEPPRPAYRPRDRRPVRELGELRAGAHWIVIMVGS